METDDKIHQIQHAKSTFADLSWIISAALTPSKNWDITEYTWDTKEKVLYIKVYTDTQWIMICDYISAARKQSGESIGDEEMEIRCWYSLDHWTPTPVATPTPTSSDQNQVPESSLTHQQK